MKNLFLCGSLQTSSYGLLSAITSRRFLPGAIIFVATLQAGALTINPVFDGSITNLATAALIKNAFNQAAQYFQNTYSDPVTVNINVYFGNQGPFSGGNPISGAASFGNDLTNYTYGQIMNFLTADKKSADDTTAVASLPASNPLPFNFMLTTAQAKALGQTVNYTNSYLANRYGAQFNPYGATNNVDGWISFDPNTNDWFFGAGSVTATQEDFIGAAEHEISEVLGRVSNLRSTNADPYGMVFDLFRYTGPNSLSYDPTANNVWFSINKGTNLLAQFNSGAKGDLHDWSTNTALTDPYDAFGTNGVVNAITAVDTQTLDVVGWDLKAVPEPGAIALVSTAVLAPVLLRLRRRKA